MSREKLVAAVVLVDFVALNVYAVVTAGLGGLVDFVSTMGPWGWVLTADLLIALGLCAVWMWRDAKRRGARSVGELVLTFSTGSVGPLVYLLRRPAGER